MYRHRDVFIPITESIDLSVASVNGGLEIAVLSDHEGFVTKEYFPDTGDDVIRFWDLRELYELIGKILEANNEHQKRRNDI